MSSPRIEVLPNRPAIKTDSPTTFDVLLTITPPEDVTTQRPSLNVGLVLDRSGSMAEAKKMTFAKEAAIFLVQQLKRQDRFSFTIFDEQIETLVPSRPIENINSTISLIKAVQPRGSTDLFSGWKEGGKQVKDHQIPIGTNRVILLSDGQANHGETSQEVMSDAAKTLAAQGVSTTTMGVGDSYNEDLLEAIAKYGDGNYYYISSPVQLMDIFQSELKELVGIAGTNVTLSLQSTLELSNVDVMNDFIKTPTGEYQLPNLIGGLPTNVVLRLTIPPQSSEQEIVRFKLAWDHPKTACRHTLEVGLKLSAITTDAYMKLAEDVNVAEQVSVMQIARLKREAMNRLDQHDLPGTQQQIDQIAHLCASMRSESPVTAHELVDLEEVKKLLDRGDHATFRKTAGSQSHRTRSSKPKP